MAAVRAGSWLFRLCRPRLVSAPPTPQTRTWCTCSWCTPTILERCCWWTLSSTRWEWLASRLWPGRSGLDGNWLHGLAPTCLPTCPQPLRSPPLQVEEIHLSFTVLLNSSNARVWCARPRLPSLRRLRRLSTACHTRCPLHLAARYHRPIPPPKGACGSPPEACSRSLLPAGIPTRRSAWCRSST